VSRAAFKLLEIQKKHKVIKPGAELSGRAHDAAAAAVVRFLEGHRALAASQQQQQLQQSQQ
jgi:hypothetical protein